MISRKYGYLQVSWLHVRLDTISKYYNWDEYTM